MSCVVIAYNSYIFFRLNLVVSFGSSVALDSTLSTKTIAYGAKYDAQQDVAMLYGKLVPTLERLELLSEVWVPIL